ncbi:MULTISPECIES: acyl-CoA thioesterase [Streptomyces]|uniref:acyl-CoA thioesterase n=1 Tax=Streptomyces TaxID=1883 RepID=UPI001E3F9D47|nr:MULTISPECIES: acyl-CoA thioesterase [Streptomyces]UFQ17178.1 acyl-CoA thioesterase [Streptomyces huasconensis]WCL86778.1 acyl-CoA thioesterase [Streptomyces sp. JCM 35825]
MSDDEQVFAHPIQPRFFEIDRQGVMFNMWYLAHVDEAVDGFFLARGLPYDSWSEMGVDVHVAHVEIDWQAGIGYGDRPEVLVSTARIGKKSFTLDFAFRKEGSTTATGRIVYVAVAADGSGSTLVPERLVAALGDVAPLNIPAKEGS